MSRKLPGIGVFTVEAEVGGEATAEFSQAGGKLLAIGLARHAEFPGAADVDFDVVPLFQVEGLDDGGGPADSEAVAPFGDLHRVGPRIHFVEICLSDRWDSRVARLALQAAAMA